MVQTSFNPKNLKFARELKIYVLITCSICINEMLLRYLQQQLRCINFIDPYGRLSGGRDSSDTPYHMVTKWR